jgi:tRNA-specific 2-thiouridylase
MSRIAVLMSGGVDSSGAAVVLKRAGHDLIGVTARLSDRSACCDDEDIYRARRVCDNLAMPHIVLDMTDEFTRRVVDPFVDAYLSGLTPNPCAICNREIKLGSLFGLAIRSGFERVASGHYARLGWIEGRPVLCEPAETQKSQVYFLSLVRPEVLDMVLLPLADLHKSDVRQMVSDLDLPIRESESQDLCFVRDMDYHDLVGDRSTGPRSGNVVDSDGNVVGRHSGHYAYTVGQRFGHKGRRYYVIEKRAETNEIVIAEKDRTIKYRISITHVNCFIPLDSFRQEDLFIKYRYRSVPVRGRVVETGSMGLTVLTEEPCFAPAPGQILACFLGDSLVCGGVIDSTE